MSNIAMLPAVCRACGTRLARRNNMRAHYRAKHPERADLPMAELVAEGAAGRPARVGRPGKALVPVAPPPPEEHPPLGAEDVDHIVVAVMGQVAPSGFVPVEQLPAVFAWREATATFLRAVSSG